MGGRIRAAFGDGKGSSVGKVCPTNGPVDQRWGKTMHVRASHLVAECEGILRVSCLRLLKG